MCTDRSIYTLRVLYTHFRVYATKALKATKAIMLTDVKIRQAKPAEKNYRLKDSHGLFLEVKASGLKVWLYRYRYRGKQQIYTIGRYPAISLAEARQKRDEARLMLDQGKNPSYEKRRARQQAIAKKSFETVALEWWQLQKDRWSKGHAEAVMASLRRDVFRQIGMYDVDDIKPAQILFILRAIEKRGAFEQARKVLQRINAVFRYAIQSGLADYNPAQDMKGALKPKETRHMLAMPQEELPEFLRKLDQALYLHKTTRLAIKFVILTACRSGEVRGATWDEIDLESATWTIPAERMKMRREHRVPLSRQALEVLEQAKTLPGQNGTYVFPGIRQGSQMLSENTLQYGLHRMGYKGIATIHGFRSVFSTIANETTQWSTDVIERALAHVDKDSVRAAYNRGDLLEERRKLMQWWGDFINDVKKNEEKK